MCRSGGTRSTTLKDALPEYSTVAVIGGWPLAGPGTTSAYLIGVTVRGHELRAHAPHWIRLPRLFPDAGLAIELTVLMTMWHLVMVVDQLNPMNLACCKLQCCQALMIQKVAERNCKAHDSE